MDMMKGMKGKIVSERDCESKGHCRNVDVQVAVAVRLTSLLERAYAPSMQYECLHLTDSAVKGSTIIKENKEFFSHVTTYGGQGICEGSRPPIQFN